MFDIGWTEMLVIAIVMIVVVGPKDLPRMLRTFGKTTTKLRAMAGDFQKQFNEALREAELDDVKKSVDDLRNLNPANEIKKQLNPFEKAAQDIRAGLDTLKPAPPKTAAPATNSVHTAEPLKNGATELPGVEAPVGMPEAAPVLPAAMAAALDPTDTPSKPVRTKAATTKSAAKGPTAPTRGDKPATVPKTVAKATAAAVPAKAADKNAPAAGSAEPPKRRPPAKAKKTEARS